MTVTPSPHAPPPVSPGRDGSPARPAWRTRSRRLFVLALGLAWLLPLALVALAAGAERPSEVERPSGVEVSAVDHAPSVGETATNPARATPTPGQAGGVSPVAVGNATTAPTWSIVITTKAPTVARAPVAPANTPTPDRATAAYVKAVPRPSDIEFTWLASVYSAGFVATAAIVLGFPGAIFNSTFTANYARIMRFLPKRRTRRRAVPNWVLLALGVGLTATVNTIAVSGLDFTRVTLLTIAATATASLITSLIGEVPHWIHSRRTTGKKSKVVLYGGGFTLTCMFALLTLLAKLQPPYVYGSIVGISHNRVGRKDRRREGRHLAIGFTLLAVTAVAAWFGREPVLDALDADPHNDLLHLTVMVLGAVFVTGVQSAVFALLPVTFLKGREVRAWSRFGWAVLELSLAVGFVYIFLSPANRKVTTTASIGPSLVLFLVFGLFSLSFWAYFKLRPTVKRKRKQSATEPQSASR